MTMNLDIDIESVTLQQDLRDLFRSYPQSKSICLFVCLFFFSLPLNFTVSSHSVQLRCLHHCFLFLFCFVFFLRKGDVTYVTWPAYICNQARSCCQNIKHGLHVFVSYVTVGSSVCLNYFNNVSECQLKHKSSVETNFVLQFT